MSTNLSAYLLFTGEARAALEFYQSVLGGEIQTMPHGPEGSPEHPDWLMHGSLTTDFVTLMAADNPWGDVPADAAKVQLCLWGDDQERLQEIFDALAEGGQVSTPLERQPWGDFYGDLRDLYGIQWSVDISPSEDQ